MKVTIAKGGPMYSADKRVILSTDSNSSYLFFMPITATVWAKYSKFSPLILIVGNEEDFNKSPYRKLALDLTKKITTDIHFINPIENVNDAQVAQISRIYACCLNLPENTYLLTSDMDMWPLSTTWFHQQIWTREFHIFNANAYSHSKYPICYCGGKVKHWRTIMQQGTRDISAAMTEQMDIDAVRVPSQNLWNYDEELLFRKIKGWPGYPDKCQLFDRKILSGGPEGRIDRSNWNYSHFDHTFIDAHLLRPGHSDENWTKLSQLLKCLTSKDDFNTFNAYKYEYSKLLQESINVG